MTKNSLSTSSKLNMSLDEIKDAGRKPSRHPFDNGRDRNSYGKGRFRSGGYASGGRNPQNWDSRQNRIYVVRVSNLDHTITKERLNEMFSSVGEVVKTWIDYDHIDRSKGTGGCIFKFADDAHKAVLKYNNTKVEGKTMELVYSTTMKERRPRRFNNSNSNNKGPLFFYKNNKSGW